jgi:hypothetical protein
VTLKGFQKRQDTSHYPQRLEKRRRLRSWRRFEKLQLGIDESQNVVIPLLRTDLSFWDVKEQTWRLPFGEIGVDVGFSWRDLKRNGKTKVSADEGGYIY